MALRWPGWTPPLVALAVTFAGTVGSIVVLALAAETQRTGLVLVLAALFVPLAVWMDLRLRRYRRDPRARIPMFVFSLGIGLLGVLLLVARTALQAPDALGFLGVLVALFGLGQALVTIRYSTIAVPWRGVAVAAGCAALFFVGLIVFTLDANPWALVPVGIGVFSAPVALGLLTEDALRDDQGPRLVDRVAGGRMLLVAGLVLFGVGLCLFLFAGVPLRFVAGLGLGLFLLVGAIASNTVIDVVVGVIVVTLVWSQMPRGAEAGEVLEPARGDEVVVALGDSFTSGEGAERYLEGTNRRGIDTERNECRRAPTAYPVVAVKRSDGERYPDRLVFLACSGANADQVHQRPAQYKGEPPGVAPEVIDGEEHHGRTQLAAWELVRDELDLTARAVVVSVGGNDALFGEIGQACVVPGKCVELGGLWLENLRHTDRELRAAYRAIRATFGTDVPVAVVPYPIPLTERSCSWSALSHREHKLLHRFTGQLNAVVRAASARAGFYYLEGIEDVLEESELRICDQRDPGEAGVNFFAAHPIEGLFQQEISPHNWIHNSFHPNHRGHRAMAGVVQEWLGGLESRTGVAPDVDRGARHDVLSIEELMEEPDLRHCAEPESGPPSCRSTTAHWRNAQLARMAWYGVVPLLLVLAGAWLLWLHTLRWLGPFLERRAPRLVAFLTGQRVTTPVAGPPPAP